MSARKALVEALDGTVAGTALADAYIEVLEEIVGAGELWRIYQAGIEQHSVSPFARLVHQATLTAAEIVDLVFAVVRCRLGPEEHQQSATAPRLR